MVHICFGHAYPVSATRTCTGMNVIHRHTCFIHDQVFKDGKLTTKERAEKKNVFLVSPLWVEA